MTDFNKMKSQSNEDNLVENEKNRETFGYNPTSGEVKFGYMSLMINRLMCQFDFSFHYFGFRSKAS